MATGGIKVQKLNLWLTNRDKERKKQIYGAKNLPLNLADLLQQLVTAVYDTAQKIIIINIFNVA